MKDTSISPSFQRAQDLFENAPLTALRKHYLDQQRWQSTTPGYRAGNPWGLQFRSLNDARLAQRGDYEEHQKQFTAEMKAFARSLRYGSYYLHDCEDPAVRADPVYQKVRAIVRRVVANGIRESVPSQWRDDKDLDARIGLAFTGMHASMLTRQMSGKDYAWFEDAKPYDILRKFSRPVKGYTAQELDELNARRAKRRPAMTIRAASYARKR
jgi:hypothetical protein